MAVLGSMEDFEAGVEAEEWKNSAEVYIALVLWLDAAWK